MKYRADIDGLRSIAIIPVIFYHVGFDAFSGGFIGVDVFFVISGFLITTILVDEMNSDSFSLIKFYERRIQRIFPALFFMMLVSSLFACLLLLPEDFLSFFRSLQATAFFISNIFFWRDANYFSAEADTKPLLHTWSLSVEEQFYIFFPLGLLFVFRYAPRSAKLILLIGGFSSFVLSVWGSQYYPVPTFFLAPTRAWELLVGCLLALKSIPDIGGIKARQALTIIGLLLVIGPVFLYGPTTTFPGFGAIPPVVGAALLIYAAEGTLVGKILSARALVFIGLISYSLYLWHWPLIVFIEYYRLEKLSGISSLIAIAMSFLLALLSWYCIEQPLRKMQISAKNLFLMAGMVMGTAFFAGLVAKESNGWDDRFNALALSRAAAAKDFSPRRDACHTNEALMTPEDSCDYGAATPARFAIYGDSQAVELAYTLGELAAKHGESIRQFSTSGCPPVVGFDTSKNIHCVERNIAVLKYIKASKNIKTIFLVANFSGYDAAMISPGFNQTVEELGQAGKRIVFIYPIPYPGYAVPSELAKLAARGKGGYGIIAAERFESTSGQGTKMLDGIIDKSIIGRVVPAKEFCGPNGCDLVRDNDVLYFDSVHLSLKGARYLNRQFEAFFTLDDYARSERYSNGS